MPKDFLLAAPGAHHAKPAVVVDVRRAEAHAGELAHQIRFLGGKTRAAENGKRIAAMRRLNSLDLAGDARNRRFDSQVGEIHPGPPSRVRRR